MNDQQIKFALGLPSGTILHSSRPEDFVRAFAVANAMGAPFPTAGIVSWLEGTCPAYDGSPLYWQPYERKGESVIVAQWARGAYAYMAYRSGGLPVAAVEPEAWYSGISKWVSHEALPVPVRAAFEVAIEQTDPAGLDGQLIVDLWTDVRRAQERAQLISDPRRIRRLRDQPTSGN